MFSKLTFKRIYTGFKKLYAIENDGKKNDSTVFEALVCTAESF